MTQLAAPRVIEVTRRMFVIERRSKDRRKLPTRMHFGTETHTEWFSGAVQPVNAGRYKVKYAGATRFVFRYWNPETRQWQFNRRKVNKECQQPGRDDLWCGLVHNKALH